MIVWIEMLSKDKDADLIDLSSRMDDPRIRWFHDPLQRVGKAIAATLGAPNLIAWDVYLFFDKESSWLGPPPRPHGWVHQLGDRRADPARYHPGKQLAPELERLLREISRL